MLASKLFTEIFKKRFRRQLFHRFPYTRTSTHYFFNLLILLLIKVTSMLPANVGDPVTVTGLWTWQSNQHIDVVNITVTFFETDSGMEIWLKGKTLSSVSSKRDFVPDPTSLMYTVWTWTLTNVVNKILLKWVLQEILVQNIVTIFSERMNTLVTKFSV